MLRSALIAILVLPLSAGAVDFAREVYPALQRACFECHGPDHQKAELRLDTGAAVKHKSIIAGKPDESDLIRRVSLPKEDKEAMPRRGERLSQAEITHLKAWIAAGAQWPEQISTAKHWSYVKPVRPALPEVKDQAWCRTEIDRFILTRLEKEGVMPAPEASPAALIRRLSLDLTGLPPSIEEVVAFEKACGEVEKSRSGDDSNLYTSPPLASHIPAKAYENLVDRLLASKEFGVRWARPWLDLARYADSHGFQRDDLRSVWGYRDWVVNALNADMPFDQFTIEQVAGDLLPQATPQQIIATGFHRCTPTNVEAGTEPEESRINQVIDRVNTTGAVWLGTTLECAQCHNHKYDPFTQRDYYGLLSYFNNTEKEAERTNPKTPGSIQFKGVAYAMPDAKHEAQRTSLTQQMKVLETQITARESELALLKDKPASVSQAVTVLSPASFHTEAGNEHDLQPDGSLLIIGDAADKDAYTFEAALPAGPLSAVMIEALTHDSIPGDGPGRGHEDRPNFVVDKLSVTLTTPDGQARPLSFGDAFASFSQKGFDVRSLIGKAEGKGWAIMPKFHQPHWAAFALTQPISIAPGSKLTLVMDQRYGGARVMGCLRVSAISGEVAAALPEPVKDEPEVEVVNAKRKGKKAKAPAALAPRFSRDPQLGKLQRQHAALQKELAALKPASTEVMRELPNPRMTTIFKRGVYTDPGEAVQPGTPAIIEARTEGANRLALARWLVSKDNPLTARVTVNRWWAELFGQGIVTTVEDFGIKGAPPTHPELLDWLAVEFMQHGWSMKQVLKQIVMSATYRQASEGQRAKSEAADAYALSPLLYAQGPRFRMDAEMIRDNALSIAGLINLKQGGEPIRPPQPEGLWQKVGGQQYKYEVSPGAEQHRRGLYVVLKRGSPYPSFTTFDAGPRMACVVKRSRSNTPLQALTLLNDPVYVEAAKAFASRIVKDQPDASLDARIQHAFRIALSRAPSAHETMVLKQLWEAQMTESKDKSAAWYAVASTLMNLDETITKN